MALEAHGVALDGGEELYAPVIVATTHPKLTFLRHLESHELPADFRESIERSAPVVRQIRDDWSPARFREKFEALLAEALDDALTAEKRLREERALVPNWVVLVEGGGDAKALEAARTLRSGTRCLGVRLGRQAYPGVERWENTGNVIED